MFSLRPGPTPFLLGLLLSIAGIRATAQVTCTSVFVNEFRLPGGNVQARAVKALPDGAMLVAGKTYPGTAFDNPALPGDGYVTKISSTGAVLWWFAIGGANDDYFTGITLLNDGGAMLYGSIIPTGHTEQKAWLVRIDAAGTMLWSRQLGSGSTSNDQPRSMQQYADGDIIGTFNIDDNSSTSDPVVFKIGMDGLLRWTHRFDNGNDESFTSIACSGDTVYAAGYYTAAGTKQAVLTELKATDGAHLSSRNIYCLDLSYQEQIVGLEIYDNMISYGIYAANAYGSILLVQTDLAGNMIRTCYVIGDYADRVMKYTPMRTKDQGFFVLRMDWGEFAPPDVIKIDRFGRVAWGLGMGPQDYYLTMPMMDQTPDGGSVTVGYRNTYEAGYTDLTRIIKTTAEGEVPSCILPEWSMDADTLSYHEQPFNWADQPAFSPWYETISPPSQPLALTSFFSCQNSACKDKTPVPPGCNKTYNIIYSVDRRSNLRDVVATPDGGRVAVGDIRSAGYTNASFFKSDGMVMKYNANGDVAWAKGYGIYKHVSFFSRVMRTLDGNFLVVGNENAGAIIMKLDNDGNIIWSRIVSELETREVEAVPTPDNGFILVGNSIEGQGKYVIRYDASANIIWKKEFYYAAEVPYFSGAACSQDAVFVGIHSNYGGDRFGVMRLDLATGKEVWTKGYATGAISTTFNRIFAIHDSVNIVLYYYNAGTPAAYTNILVTLDTLGNLYQAFKLGEDYLKPSPTTDFTGFDGTPPTAALTPDQDIALASRVTIGASDYLSLTKFRTDGTVLWSKFFPNINNYLPLNLHPQGKGFIIAGSAYLQHTGVPDYMNGFVLKLDSSGQLQAGAATGCQATDRPFAITPLKNITAWDNPVTAVLDVGVDLVTTPAVVSPYGVDVSSTLLCYNPSNCNTVTLQQKGKVCSLNDTVVYYLENAGNCGAAAAWNYDPSFFKAGLISGDSIQLIALKGGSSMIRAQIEGYCSFIDQEKPADVVLSTTSPDLGSDTVICTNVPITLHAGGGYNSYQWNDNSTDKDLLVATAGKYYVTTSDQCNHIHSDTVVVTQADSLFHLTRDTSRCNNDIVPLQASKGYNNYQWNPAYNIRANDDEAFVTPDVKTQYTVSADRRPGCTVTRSVWVTPGISPGIDLGKDISICMGDSLLLDAGPSFNSYQWSNGAGTQQVEVKQPGQYTVSALYANGCTSKDTFQLESLYKLTYPSLDKTPVLCIGSDRQLKAGPGYTSYLWNDGSTGSLLKVNRPGDYWVSVTDNHGCITSDTTHILSRAPIPANFLPKDTTICQYGDLVIQTLQRYDSYSWSDLSYGASLKVKSPGLYWAEVTDRNGCIGKDTILVTQKTCLLGVFVPSAFTPDGNGHNDRFGPLVYGNAGHFYFVVYGRWGEKVFETSTPSTGWDGRIKGVAAAAGTYVWSCRYQLDGQPEKMDKGTVILIR